MSAQHQTELKEALDVRRSCSSMHQLSQLSQSWRKQRSTARLSYKHR
jgi:hypothetical protein